MAKYTTEEVVFGANCPLPTDAYVVRINDMKKKKSAAGNPMAVTELEIVSPTSVEVLGKRYATGGQKVTIFTVLDPSMTFMAQMIEGMKRANLEPRVVQELGEGELFSDEEEDLAKFKGKMLRITIDSQPQVAMRRPTPEEKAAGIKSEPLKNPDGTEMVTGYRLQTDWSRVVGPAENTGENPY